jgi:hypothetical protein
MAFYGNPKTGMYWVNADKLGISIAGQKEFDVSTTVVTSGNVITGSDGSTGAPSYSFTADSNSGLYSTAADTIGFVAGGTERLSINDNYLQDTTKIQGIASSTNAASAFYIGDSTTSISQNTGASNNVTFAINGTQVFHIPQVTMSFNSLVIQGKPDGTPDSPSYSFTTDLNTGIYSSNQNNIDFSTGGVQRFNMGENLINAMLPIQFQSYTVAGKPAATTAGQVIYISNDGGSPTTIVAYADGTNWRRIDTGAVLT